MVEKKINDETQVLVLEDEDKDKIDLTKLEWIRKMVERRQMTQTRPTIFDLIEKL